MSLNPPSQYATESNLRARQRLWEQQRPKFDIVGWVLEVAGLGPTTHQRVLDVGCGNGMYLRELKNASISPPTTSRAAPLSSAPTPVRSSAVDGCVQCVGLLGEPLLAAQDAITDAFIPHALPPATEALGPITHREPSPFR